MYKYLLCLIIVLTRINVYCQSVENVRFEQQGDQIMIYYDLISDNTKGYCTINAYYTLDFGKTFISLKTVTGDAGRNITSGKHKKIVWNVLDDVYELTGEIKFKVTATAKRKHTLGDYDLFISLRNLNDYLPLGGRIGLLGPGRIGGYASMVYGVHNGEEREKLIIVGGPAIKIARNKKASISIFGGGGYYDIYSWDYSSGWVDEGAYGFLGEGGFILNFIHVNITMGLELSDMLYAFTGIGFTL